MHVKVFSAPSAADLESAIETWLRSTGAIKILNLTQTDAPTGGHPSLTLTVFWEFLRD